MVAPSQLRGRDEALKRLGAALDAAFAGRGQVVLVSGEAGIGKTSVATELARQGEARGASVTWGRAWEFADAPPYFPVAPCVRALDVALDPSDPFHLWESVAAALARRAHEKPIVWIVEDVHAADLGTLDLLTFLSLPLRGLRALVVATTRDKDPRITERVAQRLARMARDGMEIRLEALSEADVAAVTAEAMGRVVEGHVVRRLVELTGGNPLFVVECARAFRAAKSADGALRSLPDTVLQVVLGRVALLPAATRSALAGGAVLGREFSAALVARMLGLLPARVIDAMLPALRAGIVAETKPGSFVFSHSLVRDAIEGAVGAGERASLHRHADLALEPLGDRADILVERARHALAAVTFGAGDAAHARTLVEGASDLLVREGAFDRAFDLRSKVEDAERAGSMPAPSVAQQMRFAHVARAAGRSDVMRRLCEEIITATRPRGDVEVFARAVILLASDVRPGVIDARQVALLAEAHGMLGDAAPALAACVLARHATSLQPAKDPEVPGRMIRAAIDQARAAGDDAAILEVLAQARWGLYFAPRVERRAIALELLERARRAKDDAKSLVAYSALICLALEEGEFSAFHRTVEDMLGLSAEVGHPRHRWRALLLASMQSMMRGELREAERFVTEVAELGTLVDDAAFPMSFALHEIMRRRFQRRDDEMISAEADLERALAPVADARLHVAVLRAGCAARRRDVEATRRALAAVDIREESILAEDPTFMGLLAEASAVAGTEDQRRRCRDALERLETKEIGGNEMAFVYEGTVVRLLGLLNAALGRPDRAEKELREAHTLASERGHRAWVAQIAFELAEVLRSAGRAAEAEAFREESFELARELGMPGLEATAAPSASASASARVPPEPEATVRIFKKGDRYRVERGQRAVWVKDSRGLQLLMRLVERPNEEIHVLALASDGDDGASLPESNAGEMLDERARNAYRQRLHDLEDALAEAERNCDAGRITRLREEREALASELGRAVGLGGRARAAGSATERARVNVQRRLKDAIARVTEADTPLGRSLERAIRTGTFCSFRP